MPYAHDYYGPHHGPHDPNDFPHLHNRGEGRPYLEYDYHANDHGPQLPAISTIGRGPRGEGLTIGNVVNENGTVSFALYSDLTGELVWQSPNLAPGTLDFYPTDFRDLSAGQPAPMDIVYTKGGVTKTTTAYLPCGEPGSLVFLSGLKYTKNPSDTFQTTVEELVIYGHRTYDSRPIPRVNDIVFFRWEDDDETGIGFGTIEAVGTSSETKITGESPVVFTAHTFVPCTLYKTEGGSVEPLIVETHTDLIPDDSLQSVSMRSTSANTALYCEETAGVMYDAFVEGRPVLLRIYEGNDTKAAAYRTSYLKVVSAETDSGGAFSFIIASLHGTGYYNPMLIGSYNAVSADDYPYFAQSADDGGGGCDCEPLVVNLINVHDEYEDFQLRTDKTYREIFNAYDQGKNIIIKFDAVLDETIGYVNHYQFNLVSLAFVDFTFEGNRRGYHYDMQIYVDPTESFNAEMPAKGNVHLKNGNMPGAPTYPDDYLYSAFVK